MIATAVHAVVLVWHVLLALCYGLVTVMAFMLMLSALQMIRWQPKPTDVRFFVGMALLIALLGHLR